MAAGKINLLVEQGATFQRTITVKDSAQIPVDITGWTITGKIRATYDAASSIAEFTVALLNQTTNTGEFTITLSHTTTASMAVEASQGPSRRSSNYLYDLEAVLPDATKRRLLQGVVSVSPEVTR